MPKAKIPMLDQQTSGKASTIVIIAIALIVIVLVLIAIATQLYVAYTVSELRGTLVEMTEFVRSEKKYNDEHKHMFDRFMRAKEEFDSK